jgi:hypothetical protein
VIAELLLIVITVAIGTLVYSFASTAFGGFGAGFSNLVQNAGSQLTENVVIEQVYFLHNSTGSAGGCVPAPGPYSGQTGECAGDIFIGNSGSNIAYINEIIVTNVTSSTPVSAPANFEFFAYNGPINHYNKLLPVGGICTSTCFVSIAPGATYMLRFETRDPLVAGTTYAFTFITARGNEIVAYEKA